MLNFGRWDIMRLPTGRQKDAFRKSVTQEESAKKLAETVLDAIGLARPVRRGCSGPSRHGFSSDGSASSDTT